MDEALLTISSDSQVTIDRLVLDHLGVEPGGQVVVALLPGGRAEVRAARKGTLDAFFGSIPYDGPAKTLDDMQDGIERAASGEA